MSDSVTRSGDGWQYVTDAGLDANGRRRQHRRRGFATRNLAQAAMVEAQNAALHGELVTCGRRTLAEHPEQWLSAVQVVRARTSSAEHSGLAGRGSPSSTTGGIVLHELT